MKLGSRFTRAGATFLIFGMVTASLPSPTMISAGACGSHNSQNGAHAAWAVGGVVFGLLIFGAFRSHHAAVVPVETPPPPPDRKSVV